MLAELVLMVKDVVLLLWWVLLGVILLWLISQLIMAIYKTLFCDVQVKLYKALNKKIKEDIKNNKKIK